MRPYKVVLDEEVVDLIDKAIGRGSRSEFIRDAIEEHLKNSTGQVGSPPVKKIPQKKSEPSAHLFVGPTAPMEDKLNAVSDALRAPRSVKEVSRVTGIPERGVEAVLRHLRHRYENGLVVLE